MIQTFKLIEKKLPKIACIYAIICNKTWRSYVGQTYDLASRVHSHLNLLRIDKHYNKDLKKDYTQFGIDSFYIEILEVVQDFKKLGEKEDYWINFGCNLYNMSDSKIDIPTLTEKQKSVFWSRIQKRENGCWIWIGAKNRNKKYGRFYISGYGYYSAHRISFKLMNGYIDKYLLVCHKCDNPLCVNPEHLFLDSCYGNIKDRVTKGKTFKVNWDIVNFIRKLFLENNMIKSKEIKNLIKERFNLFLSCNSINRIISNKHWKDDNYVYKPKYNNRRYIHNGKR